MENIFLSALTGQITHEYLVKKSGLRRISFHISGLRRILLIKIIFLIIRGCILFQLYYFIDF